MPPDGITKRPHADILSYEEIVRFVGIMGRATSLFKVRLTGGEPLVRPGIDQLVAMLAGLHIPDLALTTNGQSLAKLAAPLKAAGLARVNISLDSLNAQTYLKLSQGGVLDRTLDGINEALRCGFAPLRINMVVLRGVNDSEILDMVEFAIERGIQVRFLELMPVGVAATHYREWFFSSADVRTAIQTRYSLTPVLRDSSSTCRSFNLGDGTGVIGQVGFISACSEPFCHDCNRLRLTSDGRLLGCLASDIGIPIRPLLSSGPEGIQLLEQTIVGILAQKQVRSEFRQSQVMAAIGG